jgi:hypothetical protein
MTFVGAAYVHGLMHDEGSDKEWKRYNVENKRGGNRSKEWVTLV